jgi:RHS repeat-associated protein
VGDTGQKEDIVQVVTRPNGSKQYRISDHLASLRATIDSSVVEAFDNDPWGTALSPISSPGVSRRTFNDREQDKESGQYNLGVRQYGSEASQMRSVDPMWEKFRSQSPYVYANNNPLRFTDPDGKQAKEIAPGTPLMPEMPYNGMRAADPEQQANNMRSEGSNMGSGERYIRQLRSEAQQMSKQELQAESRKGSELLNEIFKAAEKKEFIEPPPGTSLRHIIVYEKLSRRCINGINGLTDTKDHVQAFTAKRIKI